MNYFATKLSRRISGLGSNASADNSVRRTKRSDDAYAASRNTEQSAVVTKRSRQTGDRGRETEAGIARKRVNAEKAGGALHRLVRKTRRGGVAATGRDAMAAGGTERATRELSSRFEDPRAPRRGGPGIHTCSNRCTRTFVSAASFLRSKLVRG